MKKTLFVGLIVVLAMSLNSCKKEEPVLGANVKVTVKNSLGATQSGKTVYMYKDKEPTSSTQPGDAKKQIITDQNGVANFSLNFTELNILESQTSLYFVVFYQVDGESKVAGTTGITIKRDQSRTLELTIPL